MKKLLTAGLFTALLASAGAVHAGKGHTHGVGRLDIVVDGQSLSFALELPLDAAVGFERAPKTAAEKAALDNAGKLLDDGAALFAPTPAAGCALKSTQVTVPFADGKPAGSDHADIDAAYVFECATPAALKGFETAVFKHFRRLYRIEAQRVGPTGQGAGRLTPKTPSLAW
jgi:hypothetical protein